MILAFLYHIHLITKIKTKNQLNIVYLLCTFIGNEKIICTCHHSIYCEVSTYLLGKRILFCLSCFELFWSIVTQDQPIQLIPVSLHKISTTSLTDIVFRWFYVYRYIEEGPSSKSIFLCSNIRSLYHRYSSNLLSQWIYWGQERQAFHKML